MYILPQGPNHSFVHVIKIYIFHKNVKVLLETIIDFYEFELISYMSGKCLCVCIHMYVLVLDVSIGIDVTVCLLQT